MSVLPYLFGAFLCVVGLGLGSGGFKAKARSRMVAAWPVARGTVSASEVVRHSSTGASHKGGMVKRVSYEAVVRYAYEAAGKKHKGASIGFEKCEGGKSMAEQCVRRFPKGSEVDVRYNPGDPGEAYLDPRADGSARLLLIGAAILVLGLLSLINAKTLAGLFSF